MKLYSNSQTDTIKNLNHLCCTGLTWKLCKNQCFILFLSVFLALHWAKLSFLCFYYLDTFVCNHADCLIICHFPNFHYRALVISVTHIEWSITFTIEQGACTIIFKTLDVDGKLSGNTVVQILVENQSMVTKGRVNFINIWCLV